MKRCTRCGSELDTSGPLCLQCLALIESSRPEERIQAAVLAERERCAKIAEDTSKAYELQDAAFNSARVTALCIAEKIRGGV
jgi:hypothetical protein